MCLAILVITGDVVTGPFVTHAEIRRAQEVGIAFGMANGVRARMSATRDIGGIGILKTEVGMRMDDPGVMGSGISCPPAGTWIARETENESQLAGAAIFEIARGMIHPGVVESAEVEVGRGICTATRGGIRVDQGMMGAWAGSAGPRKA
jgi:hypothetical protein